MIVNGGIILIEVPNIETWSVSIFRGRHRHFTQDHLNFFSKKTLGQLLSNAGFEIIDEYSSSRKMSLKYLVDVWGNRYLPSKIISMFNSFLNQSRLQSKIISINIHDILTIIARKPDYR